MDWVKGRIQKLITALAGLSWICLWGAWIPHNNVSMTQNVFYLSEWSTFLLDVRYGELTNTPDWLRASATLSIVVFLISLSSVEKWWIRWGLRAFALIPALILLPPYPDILQLFWSQSYGGRFTASSLAFIGFALTLITDRAKPFVKNTGMLILSVMSLVLTISSFTKLLKPFEAHYNTSLIPGWGLIGFSLSLLFIIGLTSWNLILSRKSSPVPE